MNQAEQDYYLRVRPVVGQALATKRLAVWGLDLGYLAAEALARTGLRSQSWLAAGERAGQAFARSLGQEHRDAPIGTALDGHCRRHNHLESDWSLDSDLPRTTARLVQLLHQDPPDLLLAAAAWHDGGRLARRDRLLHPLHRGRSARDDSQPRRGAEIARDRRATDPIR